MTYEKVEVGLWKPEKENDFIEGIFIKAEADVGTNHSMLYHLEVDKKPVSVWGATILDNLMTAIKPGDKIKIIYLGLGEAKVGKNAPKQYDVFVDKDEEAKTNIVPQ